MRIAVVSIPQNRRTAFFLEACDRLGIERKDVQVVSWKSVLNADSNGLGELLGDSEIVRLESPGEDAEVEHQLILRGGGDSDTAELATTDPGRISGMASWYGGFSSVLRDLAAEAQLSGRQFVNPPTDVALMFDKAEAQNHLALAGVPIPEPMGRPTSFADLIDSLPNGRGRVFLKPRHGSSASGVVALEIASPERMQLVTPVELVEPETSHELPRLYNNLRLTRLSDPTAIARLVDTLCREPMMAERWFPKASVGNRSFDLRVVVIGGETEHIVVRTSSSPITNLHLGNARGDVAEVRALMNPDRWEEAMEVCRSAAAAFPSCRYVAVDLMVGSGFRSFAVAEVNAFGDLLPGIIDERGDDTYAAVLRSLTASA